MGLTYFSVGDDLGEGQWVRFMLGRSGVGVNVVEEMELILTIWVLDESGDGVGIGQTIIIVINSILHFEEY